MNVLEMGVNNITLTFKDSDREERFMDHYFSINIPHSRLCHILAIVFYLLLMISDAYFFPQVFSKLAFIRLRIITPIFIIGLIFTYTNLNLYRKVWQWQYIFYVVVTAVGLNVIAIISQGPLAPFQHMALVFSLIFGYTFIRLRYIYASLAGATVLLLHEIITKTFDPYIYEPLKLERFFLFCMNILFMMVCYHQEKTARKAFYFQEELENLNTELEDKVLKRTKKLNNLNNTLSEKVQELLEARRKRDILEAQLLQAQKMESIGTLAGGIAHDFNNILTVITGYSDVLMQKLPSDGSEFRDVYQMKRASERAAALTRQLLAFSRKQILKPEVFNMNILVSDIQKMLKRLIGENIHVSLKIHSFPIFIKMDISQLEQIIINLAVNARDAMPNGGELFIETSEVEISQMEISQIYSQTYDYMESGKYSMLSISDTGTGMTSEVLSRIFDPFFTTKDVDKGTGLGLSTVYGIVRQSNGYIYVFSALGHGTTFKVYFPIVDEAAQSLEQRIMKDDISGNEKILLVEDDKDLIFIIERALKSYGYEVTATTNPHEAITYAKKLKQAPDILITDVIMPSIDGKKLAKEIQKIFPTIPILFMTGYDDRTIVNYGILDEGVELIQKPFSSISLANRLRSILGKKKSSQSA